MNRSCRLAVDRNLCVSHRTIKDYSDDAILPVTRDTKLIAILSLLFRIGRGTHAVSAILVFAEALQLPVGWNRNRGPDSALTTASTKEFPVDSAIAARA